MKRNRLLLMMYIVVLLLCGCEPAEPLEEVSQMIHMDVTDCRLLNYHDTHGGFQGEGETIATVELTPEQSQNFLSQIRDDNHWHPLPLSNNISIVFYGGSTDELSCASLFCDENGTSLLPQVNNGWYYFHDQHTESTDCTDDSQLFSRSSYNFDAAVLDTDQNILYVFTLDT